MQLDQVYLLEASGAPPSDTTVTFGAGDAREIVLRHAPPDNAVFAVVAFDSASFQALRGAPVHVTVRPRPGLYGLSLESDTPIRSARVSFSYAVHFAAPRPALERYPTSTAFAAAMAVGRLEGTTVSFLPSSHPAMDEIRASVPAGGAYLVAAPR